MPLRLRLLNIEISFSFWFFAVVALFTLMDHEILALYIALPILVHEAGHLLVMLLLSVRVEAIRFTPISVNIRRRGWPPLGDAKEAAVILGGIAANLFFALFLYRFYFQSMRVMFLIASNLAVALFNLLPVGDLDGGQLCSLLCQRLFHPELARAISRLVSFVVLTPLFAAAIFLILTGSGNFTLLITCGYLAVTVICRE